MVYEGRGSNTFANFISDVKVHTNKCRFNLILDITVGTNANGTPLVRSLLDEPRMIPIENVTQARDVRNTGPLTQANARSRLNAQMFHHLSLIHI